MTTDAPAPTSTPSMGGRVGLGVGTGIPATEKRPSLPRALAADAAAAAAAKANPKKEKEGPETGKDDDKENAKK